MASSVCCLLHTGSLGPVSFVWGTAFYFLGGSTCYIEDALMFRKIKETEKIPVFFTILKLDVATELTASLTHL